MHIDRKRLAERRRRAIEIGKAHREGKVFELLTAGFTDSEIGSMIGIRKSSVGVLRKVFEMGVAH